MDFHMREMKIDDHEAIYHFWMSCEGLNLDNSDLRENFEIYIQRNPKLCYVALCDGEIIGTVKCGQDGRRGYLHHLAINKNFRRQGIGKELVKLCLNSLRNQGIKKCNAFVLDSNEDALNFWKYNNWEIVDYFYRTLQINLME
jgi:ribosomal protein S18 acetylase RimI-like enzyme